MLHNDSLLGIFVVKIIAPFAGKVNTWKNIFCRAEFQVYAQSVADAIYPWSAVSHHPAREGGIYVSS